MNEYSGKTIVLDTAALIDASKTKDFGDLITSMSEKGCIFYSTTDVYFEFIRGSKTLEKIINFTKFLEDLGIELKKSLVDFISSADIMLFNLVINNCFNRTKKIPSLTDVMLMLELFVNRDKDIYLMTANHKDIPAQIFDTMELIVFETSNEIRTEAIYALNKDRLGKFFEKILDKENI